MQVLKGFCRVEKRARGLERVQTLSERQNLPICLEQKAEMAARCECAAHRRLSEAEADMGIRNWEQRNADVSFMKPIENSNLKDWNCSNGLIRVKEKRLIYTENWK